MLDHAAYSTPESRERFHAQACAGRQGSNEVRHVPLSGIQDIYHICIQSVSFDALLT